MAVLEPGNVGIHGICWALRSISRAEHGVCAQKPRLVAPKVVLDAQEGGGTTWNWCCTTGDLRALLSASLAPSR